MALLRSALQDALEGRGRLVLIAGEPGIGKSTLATAIAAEAAGRGVLVSSAAAPDVSGAPPYWLWTEALRGAITPRSSEHDGTLRGRILRDLARRDRKSADTGAEATDAERFRLADAVASFLLATADRAGRLVVLDDVHAADASSLHALAHVGARVGQGRLLIVAAHRDAADEVTPAFQSMLAHVSRYDTTRRLELAGLELTDVQRQLADIIGRDVDSGTARQVYARTGGNPFFTAEVGRLIRDQRVTDPVGGLASVPPRVRDVIALRVNRLPEPTRDVLETAALMGAEIPVDLLAAACKRPPAAVLVAVEPAVSAGVVRRGTSSTSITFVHALVADALAASLPLARAAELHERIAVAIETLRATALEDWLPALARHWASAVPGEHASQRAVQVARLAAQQAEARLAFADALPLWQLALEAAGRAGASPAVGAELQLGEARALFRTGAIETALESCVRVARQAEAAHRPELMASAALVLEAVSEPAWAATLIELAESALDHLTDNDLVLQARLHAQVGGLVHLIAPDDLLREQTETRLALALAQQSGDSGALQAAVRAHQFVISGPGGAEERLRNAARMIQIARDSGDVWPEFWGRLWTFDALVQLGRLADAEVALQELEPAVAKLRWPVAVWHTLRARAAILQARGRFDEALDSAAQAEEHLAGSGLEPVARWHVAPGSGTFFTLGSGRLYTGLAAAFLGDLDRAIVDITKAVDDNTRCDAITMSVVARQELAEVLVRRGRGSDLDRARRLASGVLEDARRLGMPPFVARASALLNGMPRRRLKSDELTSREFEVASLVAEGATNRQIALKLGVSERTVENHLDHIFRKLGLGARAQLAAWVTTRITARH